MLQNHVWVKEPLKIYDKLIHFNPTEYRMLTNMVSNFTSQLTFKKLIHVEF